MRRAARTDANQAAIVKALEGIGARPPHGVEWTCAGGCGKTERRPPTKAMRLMCLPCRFASYAGSGNPNFKNAAAKVCHKCGKEFKSYSPTRKYCSSGCYHSVPRQAPENRVKYGGRKDHNHTEIVQGLQSFGASVIDTSHVGRGFPDLIVGFCGQTLMMEIKNPKTAYGRAGLSDRQKRWKEEWNGGPYAVVSSVHGAVAAVSALGPVATVTDVEGAIRAVTLEA